MAEANAGKDRVVLELQQAVERLRVDLARVEFWADALGGFSQPVPDYEQSGTRVSEYVLPYRKVGDALEQVRKGLRSDRVKQS